MDDDKAMTHCNASPIDHVSKHDDSSCISYSYRKHGKWLLFIFINHIKYIWLNLHIIEYTWINKERKKDRKKERKKVDMRPVLFQNLDYVYKHAGMIICLSIHQFIILFPPAIWLIKLITRTCIYNSPRLDIPCVMTTWNYANSLWR